MKETLNKVFGSELIKSLTVLVVTALVFQFLIFPGLTVANTILNIASGLLMLINLIFIYYFFKIDSIFSNDKSENSVESGETELDYVSPKEIKAKVRKKKGEILSEDQKKGIIDNIKEKGLYVEPKKTTKTNNT
jgi:hypothetical protein